MKLLPTLFTLFVSASLGYGQIPKLPAEVTVQTGRLAAVTIESTGGTVKWVMLGATVDSFREYDPDTSKVRLRLIGYEEATVYLVAYSCSHDVPSDPAVCRISFTNNPGPGPGPGPGPTPDPNPTLTWRLQASYDVETDANKKEYVPLVAAIYKNAGPLVDASNTYSDLYGKLSTALHAEGLGVPRGAIPYVWKDVGSYLNEKLGTNPTAKVDVTLAKKVLADIGSSLGRLKR